MVKIVPAILNKNLCEGISRELLDPRLLDGHDYREFFATDLPKRYEHLHHALGRVSALGKCFGIPSEPHTSSVLVWQFTEDTPHLPLALYNGDIHRDMLRKRVLLAHSSNPMLNTSTLMFTIAPDSTMPNSHSLTNPLDSYLQPIPAGAEGPLELKPLNEQPEELRFSDVTRAPLGGAVVFGAHRWHCVLPPPPGTCRVTFSSTDIRPL